MIHLSLYKETESSPSPSPCATAARISTCSPAMAGSYLRLIDCCITRLKAQGPSRTCDESKEEEVVTSPVFERNVSREWENDAEEGSHLRLIEVCITRL